MNENKLNEQLDNFFVYINKKIQNQEEEIRSLKSQVEFLIVEYNKETDKRKKKSKKDLEREMQLQDYKEQFLKSEPNNRNDLFTNEELALWFVYCKMNYHKGDLERINTWNELYKRSRGGIQNVINWFIELGKNTDVNDEELDEFSRKKAKLYLEYMAVIELEGMDKNHYTVCSDWCLNLYGSKTGNWQRIRKIKDEPLNE